MRRVVGIITSVFKYKTDSDMEELRKLFKLKTAYVQSIYYLETEKILKLCKKLIFHMKVTLLTFYSKLSKFLLCHAYF